MLILLIVIAGALSSTMLLDRSSQILVLKAFLVFILSLIPGWLYLQFIDRKSAQLYDEYVLNLFRLKVDQPVDLPMPPAGSSQLKEWKAARRKARITGDIADNVYLKKFENVYGVGAVPQSRRNIADDATSPADGVGIVTTIRQETFSPVIVTTALMAVGWTAFVQPELYRELAVLRPSVLNGLPVVAADPLRFGFLGAYTFVLQSFVRRYFSSDLKTRAFVSAMLRVILVAALVLVVHPIWLYYGFPAELEVAFAFLIGYFPDSAFRLIKTKALGTAQALRFGSDEERFPLRQIDGLNLWYEARLVEEGVENMQNLSTTTLVDLMVSTRTPIARLIDWVDQAYLYLRVKEPVEREALRAVGIRNATDLVRVFDCSADDDPAFHERLTRLLNVDKGGNDDQGASRVRGIRYSLDGEVNLVHVRHYRSHAWLEAPPLTCEP